MPLEIKHQLQGFEEIKSKLKALPTKFANKILRKGTAAGARVLVKAAQQNVTKKSGVLHRSIRLKFNKTVNLEASYEVGLAHKAKGYYGRFIEEGADPHLMPKSKKKQHALVINGKAYRIVHHPGIKPKPWFKPAFDSNTQAIIDRIRLTLSTELNKTL